MIEKLNRSRAGDAGSEIGRAGSGHRHAADGRRDGKRASSCVEVCVKRVRNSNSKMPRCSATRVEAGQVGSGVPNDDAHVVGGAFLGNEQVKIGGTSVGERQVCTFACVECKTTNGNS
eukprot:1849122-Pyramimonas_sp.AAC.2